jgi:hypothetical protein
VSSNNLKKREFDVRDVKKEPTHPKIEPTFRIPTP